MNQTVRLPNAMRVGHSACPHDCPSTCALEVEILDERTIGRVRGAKDNDYTAGVICAKVARYAEREHHPQRLLYPLRRNGDKGSGKFERISWNDALDLVAEKFIEAERRHGAESIWPYYYAGTMGLVMRDGIHRLRHVKKYSGFHSTICVNPAYAGYAAGIGRIAGADPREMAKSDLVIIWGTNAVNTQVNVMTHAVRARKERGAKIAAVDIYMNGTMEQADLPVLIKPGTDGALACAVMHCLFRDGKADWDYLEKYTDAPRELEAHLRSRDPRWAAAITGAPVETIEEFARLIGERKRAFFPPWLWLFALTQWPGEHARGKLHSGCDRCVAVRRRRRFPYQRRHFPARQDLDRRSRRLGPLGADARSISHRGNPDRRARSAARRRAGYRDDHPEHQSGIRVPRSDTSEARVCARGSFRLCARAVHDGNRASR
jgi:anaerobic selenocysteine-containing dehydrogenase